MTLPDPSVWQNSATGLNAATAHDRHTAGLVWHVQDSTGPKLFLPGGVRAGWQRLIFSYDEMLGSGREIGFGTEMGRIAIPTQTLSFASEAGDWSYNEITYNASGDGAAALKVTISRSTPALLIDTVASSLQLFTGAVTYRTITGGNVTDVSVETDGIVSPKYIAYHEGGTRLLASLSGSDTPLTLDQPWLMLWLGTNSHFVDTKYPVDHSQHETEASYALPQSYAYRGDAPCLLVFENNPNAVRQDAAGGIRITWSGAGGKVALLPLYGRNHQDATTTNGWAGAFPAAVQTLIDWWRVRLLTLPISASETYAYAGGDATVSETFTFTTVGAGGTQFAPLPPMVAMVRDVAGWSCTGTVTGPPTAYYTDFGPYVGIDAAATYDYSFTVPSLTARTLGSGTIDGTIQSEINAQVDKITGAGGILSFWAFDTHFPQGFGGDCYFLHPGEPLAKLADIVPLVSGTRRTALLNYMSSLRTTYPPETTTNLPSSGLVDLGGYSVEITDASWDELVTTYPDAAYSGWRVNTRVPLYGLYGLSRYYDVTSTMPSAGEFADCQDVLDAEMAEQDWATGYWFDNYAVDQGATAAVNRLLGGMIGMLRLAQAASDASQEAQAWALFTRVYLLRLAIARYQTYLVSAGLLSYPASSTWFVDHRKSANAAWSAYLYPEITGVDNDPRTVLFISPFGVFLHENTNYRDWTLGSDDYNGLLAWRHITCARYITYEDLVPEAITLLENESSFLALANAVTNWPTWYVAFDRTKAGREKLCQLPGDIHQVFKTLAITGTATAAELKSWRDIPQVDIGDLFYLDKLNEIARAYAQAGGPTISGVQASAATVGQYAKWTVTFELATVATKPDLPYDAAAPTGADGTSGVTVNLLVSNDNWGTQKVIPCARWLDYDYVAVGGDDWFLPVSPEHYRWEGRFAPPTAGTWAYKVQAIDSTGTSEWGSGLDTFVCTADANRHGFIVPAPSEPKRFAHDDGSLFLDIGCTAGAFVASYNHPRQQVASYFNDMAAAGIKLMRLWLSSHAVMGVTGHQWRPAYNGGSELSVCNNDGAGKVANPAGVFSVQNLWAKPKADQDIGNFGSPYVHLGWMPVFCITPNATYRVRVVYAIPRALTARDATGGRLHGFCVKANAIWPGGYVPYACPEDGGGSPLSTPLYAQTVGYTTANFTWNAPNSRYAHVWLVMQNCEDASGVDPVIGGSDVMIASVSIQEDLGGGLYGPEICPATDWNLHEHVNQDNTLHWDEVIKNAETANVALQLVVESKEDNIYACINPSTGAWQAYNVDTVYGVLDATTITPSRWYQRALWRQVQARWGYSSSVFACELLNEADAHAEGGYYLAEMFAQYMATFGNAHMTGTSTDDSYPTDMWAIAPSLSYHDVHCYRPANADSMRDVQKAPQIQAKFADADDWGDTAAGPPRLQAVVGTYGTYGPGTKPMRIGETGLVPSDTSPASPEVTGAAGDVAIHKLLWSGGAFEGYWWPEHLWTGDHDRRGDYGRIYDVLSLFPLHDGNYQDASPGFTGDGGLLRAVGELSSVDGTGYIWVDNSTDTFANKRASVAPTLVSGASMQNTVPAGDYDVTIKNTRTGAVISSSTVTAS